MKRLSLLLILSITLGIFTARADEGMWIPVLIEKYNIRLMQENGFKLTAEDIYSINKASMKDAVVLFGGGCTGEFISDKGLIITNHHCGYGSIQNHSTLEHDYLADGFWAASNAEELSNPGLTVTIMKYMEDVTDKVLEGVTEGMEAGKEGGRDKCKYYYYQYRCSQGHSLSGDGKAVLPRKSVFPYRERGIP